MPLTRLVACAILLKASLGRVWRTGWKGPEATDVKKTLYPDFAVNLFTHSLRRASREWVCLLALAFIGLAAACATARAEPAATELLNVMEAEGFENLVVAESPDGTLRVAFEDRRYRWEVYGLGVALAMAAARHSGPIVVIPLHTGIPMARIAVTGADYRAFLRGDLSEDELFARTTISNTVPPEEKVRVENARNRSFGKVDITFSPGIRINLITPAPPGVFSGGEVRVNPGVYSNLWRGLTFDATYSYPLSSSDPVIARAAASVNARVGNQGFLQAQGGRLADGLNGFAGQFSYLSRDGRHLVGANAASAGYSAPGWERTLAYQAFYSVRAWDVAADFLNRASGHGGRLRPDAADVVLTFSAGRYLARDDGYGLTLSSGFRERRIEFALIKTKRATTLAAGFVVPLGHQRQPYPGPVRARWRNEFGFVYTDPMEKEWDRQDSGLYVPFMDRFQLSTRRLNRAYLRAYADRLRQAGRGWSGGELPADATESRE
ncbi:MAG: hypothetical protein HY321_13100 [Armatimonadetes bacterium]|nr:hypothetical protein [Armatimonadota bacterium]